MNRWIRWVWQAFVGMGEVEYPFPEPVTRARRAELSDDAVSVTFWKVVEREWGGVLR